MSTTVSRNPFARGEYVRECHANTDGHRRECLWCGQSPQRLYSYTWADDGKSDTWRSRELFCNMGCFHSYHG